MSTAQISLRWMDVGDETRYAQMAFALWPHLPYEEHLEEISRMLKNSAKRRGVLASVSELEQAGFADVSLRDYVNGCTSTPVPMLEGIWVDPACRRMGVGEALVEFIENWARSEGYCELCSDTGLDNLTSQKSHLAWGFEEYERVVIFRKSLDVI